MAGGEAVLERLGAAGVVPAITLDRAEDGVRVARALVRGGIGVGEITFRTPAAAAAIARVAAEVEGFTLGAGTVLEVAQARTAIAAGARFVIAPGLDPAVVEHCLAAGVVVIPGVCTPTEIGVALGLGLGVVKLFPAEPLGGVGYLGAVSEPFGDALRYLPSGGIGPHNLEAYLAVPCTLAVSGSWLVRRELIAAGDEGRIERLARAAAGQVEALARGARAGS